MTAESTTAGAGPRVKVNGDTRRRSPVERVETWDVSRLKPYAQNPRLHSAEQVDQIAASFAANGQTQLVLVGEDGEVIAGHGRLAAVLKLGWKRVRVAVAAGWTEQQKRAYRIADNKIGLNSEWDGAMLKAELAELRDDGFDLSLTGFDADALVSFLADPTAPGEFKAFDESTPTDHQCPKCGYKWSVG